MKRLLLLLLLCVPAFAQIQAWNYGYNYNSGSPFSLTLSSSSSGSGGSGCKTNQAYLIVAVTGNAYYSAVLAGFHSTNIPNASWNHSADIVKSGGTYHLALWWAYSTSISDSETISDPGGVGGGNIIAQCFSGVVSAAPQIDQSSTAPCPTTGNTTACLPGSVTPTQGGELLVAAAAIQTTSFTVNSGFTMLGGAPYGSGPAMSMAYLIQTFPPAVENPSFSFSNQQYGEDGGTWIATFFAQNPPADYTVSGPSSGYLGAASSAFTLTKNTGNFTGSTTVTVADGGKGGTVTAGSYCTGSGTTPVTLTPTGGQSTCTFTYTPAVTGTITLSFTGAGMSGLNPAGLSYTSNPWSLADSCASGTGVLGASSGICTVTLTGGTFNGSYSVTISDSGEYSGGTFTPSVGSPTTSTVTVTPANGSSNFTYTYTPTGTVGGRLLNVTNAQNWANPANVTYTATSGDVCAFTAKASGNWNASATWTPSGCSGGGHATPTSGDTVVITGFHVTCSSGTCLVGTAPANNTTYDLTITNGASANGVLEVQSGATLVLTSNYQLVNTTATSSPSYFPILQVDTGGTFVLDNNNSASVSYRGVGNGTTKWGQVLFGTAGDSCTFGPGMSYSCATNYKGVNVAGGVNPVLWSMNGIYDDIVPHWYGTGFLNCGSATLPCLDDNSFQSTYAVTVDVEGSVFDSSYPFGNTGLYNFDPSVTFVWKNNREVRDLIGFEGLAGPIGYTTGSCTIQGNYFDAATGGDPFTGCNFTWNTFSSGLCSSSTPTNPWGSFQHNMDITLYTGCTDKLSYVPLIGNYRYEDNPTGITTSNHISPAAAGPGTNLGNGYAAMIVGDICEVNSNPPVEGHCGGQATSPVASPYPVAIVDSLAPMTVAGANPGTYWTSMVNPSGATSPIYYDHNGVNGQASGSGNQGWSQFYGHGGGNYYPTNAIFQTFRSSIGWAPSSGSDNYQIADLEEAVVVPAPNTLVNASTVIDWNDSYHATASTLFTTGFDSACTPQTSNPFYGTPYQICTTTVSPGSHETTVDPKYIDTSRRADTWASRVMGQAQSINGARAALWGSSSMQAGMRSLVAWVRQGWQPTNMALKGRAHDGKIVGFKAVTAGSGYSGTCGVTITPQDAEDLGGLIPGQAAAATCTFSGGVPVVTLTNGGSHYRVATPATVAITCGGCTPTLAAVLTPIIQPSDIGPVQMYLFASVAP